VSDGDGGEGQGMDDRAWMTGHGGQGMDDSVIVIPGSPRRGGRDRDRDVSIIDISDSSKVPRYITIHYDTLRYISILAYKKSWNIGNYMK
jgi:hypothetical protein